MTPVDTEVRARLSWMWVFVMLNMIFADIFSFMNAGTLQQIMEGRADQIAITPEFLLLAAVLAEIPIAMVVLCRRLAQGANVDQPCRCSVADAGRARLPPATLPCRSSTCIGRPLRSPGPHGAGMGRASESLARDRDRDRATQTIARGGRGVMAGRPYHPHANQELTMSGSSNKSSFLPPRWFIRAVLGRAAGRLFAHARAARAPEGDPDPQGHDARADNRSAQRRTAKCLSSPTSRTVPT